MEIDKEICGIGDGMHEGVRYFNGCLNRSLLLPTSICYPYKRLEDRDEIKLWTPASGDEIVEKQSNSMQKITNTRVTIVSNIYIFF